MGPWAWDLGLPLTPSSFLSLSPLGGSQAFPASQLVCVRMHAHAHTHTHTRIPACAGPLSRASEPGHSRLYQVLTCFGSTEPKDLPILQMRKLRLGEVNGFTKVSQDSQV